MNEQMSDKFRNNLIMYFDMGIRGLIAFFFAGICLYAVLVGIFHINPIYTLPIAFLVSILISPFLSKVKLGERVFLYYDNFLNKLFKLK